MQKLLILFLIIYILYFSSSMLIPILPLYFKIIGFTPLLIGIVMGVLGLMRAPLTLVTGVFADALGKRRTIILGALFSAAGVLLLLLKSVALIITGGRILMGVFGSFLTPTIWALISEEASRTKTPGKALTFANALTAVAGILAPAMAGYLASMYGYEIAILISALLLLNVTHAAWITQSEARQRTAIREIMRRIPGIFTRIYPYPIILALEWYMLYSNMMLLPLYMNSLMYSVEIVGFVLTLETLIYTLCQPLVGYVIDKYRPRYILMLGTASIYGLSLAYIPHCRNLLHIMLVLTIIALSSSPISPVVMARIAEETPELRTVAMGLLFSAGYLGMTLGTVISGLLAQVSYQLAYGQLVIPGVLITILTVYDYFIKVKN